VYESKHGKPLKPIRIRVAKNHLSHHIRCPHCDAPHIYLYYNDGKIRSQLKCKVCGDVFQLHRRFRRTTKYFCPYCFKALFTWKQSAELTIYKCHNHNCPHRVQKLKALNADEKKLRQQRLSQFKVNYQYRDYHYPIAQLKIAEPDKPKVDLKRIYNDINIFALVLTLHISYAITARKTAHMLRNIWNIPISYQTVLNYVQAAAYYCHQFNVKHKGPVDEICAGDETYVKVKAVWHYIWLFIGSVSKKICAYHFSDNRGPKAAITTLLEAVRTAPDNQKLTVVTDGNPSYQAAVHFINKTFKKITIALKTVIGLQNLDQQSEEFRPYKQMIERLNRTYKYHVQAQNGFASVSGAVAKMVLFVTHYNFLRSHRALNYKTPIQIPELNRISTVQGKWVKILSMAA